MRSLAAVRLVLCSLIAAVPACGDDGGNSAVPDAMPGDRPDAMTPDLPPDAGSPGDRPDAMPPGTAPDAAPPAPMFVLSTQAITADEGEPAGATFALRLSEAPGRTVTVAITSDDETVAVVDKAALAFDDTSYDIDQVVRVTAVDDADIADESATITITEPGVGTTSVAVTVVDDDTVTIVADPTVVLVNEGGTSSFTVRLGAQPGADVTVTIASSDPDAAAADPTALTFTPADHDQPQTVTVTGVEDGDASNEAVTMTLSAPGLTDVAIGVGVADND
jgi:cellulose 1,4-beta-cellobiosidase